MEFIQIYVVNAPNESEAHKEFTSGEYVEGHELSERTMDLREASHELTKYAVKQSGDGFLSADICPKCNSTNTSTMDNEALGGGSSTEPFFDHEIYGKALCHHCGEIWSVVGDIIWRRQDVKKKELSPEIRRLALLFAKNVASSIGNMSLWWSKQTPEVNDQLNELLGGEKFPFDDGLEAIAVHAHIWANQYDEPTKIISERDTYNPDNK